MSASEEVLLAALRDSRRTVVTLQRLQAEVTWKLGCNGRKAAQVLLTVTGDLCCQIADRRLTICLF